MRTGTLRHACAALLFATSLTAQYDQTRTGKCFTVILHAGKLPEPMVTRFADQLLAAAESTVPALERLQLRPGKPRTIHVHADEAEYREAEKKLERSKFKRESFCRATEGEAHVVFWPQFIVKDLEIVGLPPPTLHAVIVQAAQLAVFDRSDYAVADPWLAGLLAQVVLELTLYPRQAVGVDPVHDDRRPWLSDEGRKSDVRQLRDMCVTTTEVTTRSQQDYIEEGHCYLAQLCVASSAGWARRLLSVAPKRGDTRMQAVEAAIGKDWTKNEERFAKLVAAARAPWWIGAPVVALRDKRLLLAGGTATAAVLNFRAPPPGAYAVRATAELVKERDLDLRVQLDWDGESVLGCFLEPGEVRVSMYSYKTEKWQVLGTAKAPIAAGKPFTFELEVGAKLKAFIDGQGLLEVDYGKRTMRGPWSVAKNDGPAWLQDLRIEPLAPAGK